MLGIPALWIGLIIGAVEGATILFAPEEPHKVGIFFAATLKGFLNGLLVGFSITAASLWWQGLGFGFVYGCVLSFLVVLPDGGVYAKDAKYILPFGIVAGCIIGLLAVLL